jgi:predicted metal-dependent phosphoesterase TrpH
MQATLSNTMKIDLHCHSKASFDCRTSFETIIERCHVENINVQAITDHNEVWGALELQTMTQHDPNLTIIVGEEILTNEGELIGLFLEERIEPGLSPEKTILKIKEQGGLVLLPHGFDPFKRLRLQAGALERVKKSIQIVEIFNAHISRPGYNDDAWLWANAHGKLTSAGSDAHTASQIGGAWTETPWQDIQRPEDLLLALNEGKVMGTWQHPAFGFISKVKNMAHHASRRLQKTWRTSSD